MQVAAAVALVQELLVVDWVEALQELVLILMLLLEQWELAAAEEEFGMVDIFLVPVVLVSLSSLTHHKYLKNSNEYSEC
jgi:hypothetical protein